MVAESVGLDEEILSADGGLIGSQEFARRLGLKSEGTVRDYFRHGKVIALTEGKRRLWFSAWQIHEGKLLRGLAQVIEALREQDIAPLSMVIFFVYETDDLDGRRPLDLLREGRVDQVVQSARGQLEMRP